MAAWHLGNLALVDVGEVERRLVQVDVVLDADRRLALRHGVDLPLPVGQLKQLRWPETTTRPSTLNRGLTVNKTQ